MAFFEKELNQQEPERVILAGASGDTDDGRGTGCTSDEISLAELERLVETAGGQVVATLLQNRQAPEAATFLGSGKVEELRELGKATEASLVVFDNELTPAQIKNLEDATDLRVIDRSMLILDIFALHATTGEGKLQVAMAQLRYTLPRLTGKGTQLSRLGAGIGTRGPGESKLEIDRRRAREQMSRLRAELEELRKNRAEQRRQRDRSGLPRVAIIGYTNAGKSTLLNYLTGAGVLAEDKLFATLDSTTRKLTMENGFELLLTDTVGFIRKLPHHLVEAFASTLDEVRCADLLLQVVDVSDPEADRQMEVTGNLLKDLDAGDKPMIIVYNKAELAGLTVRGGENEALISAKTGAGVPELLDLLYRKLTEDSRTLEVLIPYDKGNLLQLAYDGVVLEKDYRAEGVYLKITGTEELRSRLEEYSL